MNKFIKTYIDWFWKNSSAYNIPEIICEEKDILIKDFYKNIFKVTNDNSNDFILCENVAEINYGSKLISKIQNGLEIQKYLEADIKQNISKQWKYYQILQKTTIPLIYVYKFNFNDYQPMKTILLHHFPNDKQYILTKESQQLFFNNCSNLYGFIYCYNNMCLMFLNENNNYHYTKNTINHQLTHYFQKYLNVNYQDIIFKQFKQLKTLNLTVEKQQYCFNKGQFRPIVLIDFIQQIKKIYYVQYSKLFNKEEFLTYLFNTIQNNPLNVFQSEFGKEYLKIFKNILPLSCVCAAKYYNIRFDFIKNKCRQGILE